VRDWLLSSARTFGLLNTPIGVGLLAGGQLVRTLAKRVLPERLVSCAVGWTAVSSHILPASAGTLLLGVCAALIMITSQTLMQQETAQEMLKV
jgi:hypothetical protein